MSHPPQTVSFEGQPTTKPAWTLARTSLVFVAAYVVWQPVAAYVLPILLRHASPFNSVAQLPPFLLAVAGIGLVAGILWWIAARQPRGRRRWILRSISRMLALSTMLTSSRFVESPIVVWLSVLVWTAVVMGLLFHWTERWEDRGAPAASAP